MQLPIVSKDTMSSVLRDSERKLSKQFISEMKKRLTKKNPLILEYLEYCLVKSKDIKIGTDLFISGLLLYRMLESQQEAEDLEKQKG